MQGAAPSFFPVHKDGFAGTRRKHIHQRENAPDSMIDPDKTYSTITTLLFVALIFSVFFFSDLVAVIIIVTSVAGLALRWLTQQHNVSSGGWQEERERWKDGERWW